MVELEEDGGIGTGIGIMEIPIKVEEEKSQNHHQVHFQQETANAWTVMTGIRVLMTGVREGHA